MDFKIAGTHDGITAIQLDIKVGGIPVEILCDALDKAKTAREEILQTIIATISAPRATISKYAPHIVHMKINPEQIGLVIGGGGKTIKMIKEKTGAEITIEDSGDVFITGTPEGTMQAKDMIGAMTKEWVSE
jgi:polyribonucleotide nucleotidyltransferase